MVGRSVNCLVVTDNNVAILGRVHVKFNGARTILQCLGDGEQRRRRCLVGAALVGKGNDASSAPKITHARGSAPRETR